MAFAAGLRKFTFTTHVTSSVGWGGAVVVFFALAIIGLISEDEATVRGAYLVMAPAAWFVLVPLAHASLLSGIALSLGTTWGLFRHYWVVFKLVITVFSTVILLIYMGTFRQMAGVAAEPVAELALVRNPSPIVHAILALVLLLTATVLAVYKPFGTTAYGTRKQDEDRQRPSSDALPQQSADRAYAFFTIPRWLFVFAIVAFVTLLLLAALHFSGAGFRH
jgi:hypothetical protein